ncbi:Uncharacterised protein [Yersinia enterocolitica]|nr:Uncharacterised protein [Yersinia enterocolitica]
MKLRKLKPTKTVVMIAVILAARIMAAKTVVTARRAKVVITVVATTMPVIIALVITATVTMLTAIIAIAKAVTISAAIIDARRNKQRHHRHRPKLLKQIKHSVKNSQRVAVIANVVAHKMINARYHKTLKLKLMRISSQL